MIVCLFTCGDQWPNPVKPTASKPSRQTSQSAAFAVRQTAVRQKHAELPAVRSLLLLPKPVLHKKMHILYIIRFCIKGKAEILKKNRRNQFSKNSVSPNLFQAICLLVEKGVMFRGDNAGLN